MPSLADFTTTMLELKFSVQTMGAMTGEMFLAYVEQCLVPTLRRNDIVMMDNCRVYMAPAVREATERRRRVCGIFRNTRLT
jgi:hypothetical protein